MIRVAINGFGRIGRNTLKAGWNNKNIKFVGINDLTEPKILAHLLRYDSVFGRWDKKVEADANHLIIAGQKIPVTAEKDPANLPWGDLDVDVVIESTGRFTDRASASGHLKAGAKRVVISAPAKNTPTYLMGVNHKKCRLNDKIINNASCTTNSIAPVAAIMAETFGIKKAMMTTIHSATAGQSTVDGVPTPPKNDLRRSRSALVNMIPTSTGAAIATTEVIPRLKNKFDGIAVRVPTIDVSLSDFTFVLRKKVTVEQVNREFKKAARSARWKGVLGVTDEPLVSSDFIGCPLSSVVDLSMTRVVDGDLVKVMAWYDNEWGYSVHLLQMVENTARFIKR
ncbi:MAG: type I glyceraldehyde-3-phosphate dehydrogenase [Candidatus Uhrbacteria bacterium]